jgi:hypothetical protein
MNVETPPRRRTAAPGRTTPGPAEQGLGGPGEVLAWVGGIVLLLGPFTSWYSIGGDLRGTLSVTGWNSGTIGKLVFFAGLAVLVVLSLRFLGVELPPGLPSGLVIAVIGATATILVVWRLVSIPERFEPAVGRSLGIWISLLAGLLVVAAGLLKSADEA